MVMEQSQQLMDKTPSPQCVGREFVRQYYTVLNEAPMHLHRFYSDNSSFVHGGVEKPGEEQPPAMGQTEIHKKICSLNFKDCHAKIRQVDSQATVEKAVVVQVTGELSNSGQTMRRFMQTFVLVPQAPKQYYVHNDIFRYQDEVFDDTDPQEESVETEPSVSESDMDENIEPTPTQDTVPSPAVSTTTYFSETPQAPLMSNGTVHVDECLESPPSKPVEELPKVEEQPSPEVVYEQKIIEKTPEPEPVPAPATGLAGRTWAAMLKTTASSGVTQPPPVQVAPKPTPAPVVIKPEPKVVESREQSGPQPQRAPRPTEEALPQRPPRDRGSREPRDGSRQPGDGEDARRLQHPDRYQVFVGNIPHHLSEADLKQYFEQFGKVVDARINKKPSIAGVLNFGFVVFEEDKTVQTVLSNKKGFVLNSGHRLNVEEKKRVDGMRSGSGTRGSGRGGPGRGGSRGGRGGPGGPRPDTRERSGDRPPRGGGSERGGFGQRR